MNKHVVILGAGLSGLSAAWFLKQRGCRITLLEKSSRVGGCIRTINQDGFLFEQGPHSCRPYGEAAGATLRMIEGLGLQEQVIAAHPNAKQRYLYYQQKLQPLPKNVWNVLTSPLMCGAIPALWRDLTAKKGNGEDESVAIFMRRHIGNALTDRFFDPLVSGIYAGNMDQLSMAACFPTLFQWEKQHGSLLKGAWSAPRAKHPQTPFAQRLCKAGLFSFRNGMETLTTALGEALSPCIKLSTEAAALHVDREGIEVQLSNGERVHADHVVSALPSNALARLVNSFDKPLAELLTSIHHASVVVVNLGYRSNLLNYQGFGHLVPTQEQEEILGVIWDSSVFPEQNQKTGETRLTVMMGGVNHPWICALSRRQQIEIALRAVAKQLQIERPPDAVCTAVAQEAIPQYQIGHLHLLSQIAGHFTPLSPHLSWIGNSFHGVSINDCVAQAEQLSG